MSEWTDIGEQLRKARESKGLDIRDVAHTTRIPLASLEALERSDYSIFPSPSYARSFLSQYSGYLGVDAQEWIDAFDTGNVLSNVGDNRRTTELARRHGTSPGHMSENVESGTKRTPSAVQTLTVSVVTALLIGGGIFAHKKFEHLLTDSQGGETAGPAPEKNETKTEAQPAEIPPADPDNQPRPTARSATTGANGDTREKTNPGRRDTGSAAAPALIKPGRSGKPPKAMVVEE